MLGRIGRPRRRSWLRLRLGRGYHLARRYCHWWLGGARYARVRPEIACPFEHASHHTPLIRRLRDVDLDLQYNKVVNLRLAVARLNGRVLLPGETLSYWKAIGNPTRRKGYLPGMIITANGFSRGTGGGLCQLSNLIFWMTLHTPLTVVERHRHSYDVFPDEHRTQPFGSGATCYYNYLDLVLRNDTEHPFRLSLEVGEDELFGHWYADCPPWLRYEVYEAEHLIRYEPWGAYTRNNLLRRRVFDRSGVQLADEYLLENHAFMQYTPFLEDGSAAPPR